MFDYGLLLKNTIDWSFKDALSACKAVYRYSHIQLKDLDKISENSILDIADKVSQYMDFIQWNRHNPLTKTYLIFSGKIIKLLFLNTVLSILASKLDKLADTIRQNMRTQSTMQIAAHKVDSVFKHQIALKLSLVENALEELAKAPKFCVHSWSYFGDKYNWLGQQIHGEFVATAHIRTRKKELYDYFNDLHQKLSSGQNVPIPQWYHATGSGKEGVKIVKTIIEKEELTRGLSGKICASTQEELYYGPVTLALDHYNTWENKEVYYYHREEISTPERLQTWICTFSDSLSVTQNDLAFIATEKRLLNDVRNIVHACGKSILVIDRELSWQIKFYLDLAEEKKFGARMVPPTWVNNYLGKSGGTDNEVVNGRYAIRNQ